VREDHAPAAVPPQANLVQRVPAGRKAHRSSATGQESMLVRPPTHPSLVSLLMYSRYVSYLFPIT
jgi:hypothetical protein